MLKNADEKKPTDIGVVVGRFQVDTLTQGHRDLLIHAFELHKSVIIILGSGPIRYTKTNPLDFEMRQAMLLEELPYNPERMKIRELQDNPSDKVWSKNLDAVISSVIPPGATVTLYGSRDSFIKYYSGRFSCQELVPNITQSATERRKELALVVPRNRDSRAAICFATAQGFGNPFPTIDAFIWLDSAKTKFLMAKKKIHGGKCCFVGGFIDSGENAETAVRREASEETGLSVDGVEYVGSFVVDDWRYRRESTNILTFLFEAGKVFGRAEARDDIDEIVEYTREQANEVETNLVYGHVPLFQAIRKKYGF